VWNLLEDRFVLLLANAQHSKAVPGRKSDVKDCEWIADLLRHGLLRSSFVPARPQRELTRYRTALGRDRSREINRRQKTLEAANIKLPSVLSQLTGVSAQAMLRELAAGNTDWAAIAAQANGQLSHKQPQLSQALTGTVGSHQRCMVAQHLVQIEFLDAQSEQVSAEIEDRLDPFARQLEMLESIPGLAQTGAEIMLAEIGPDMNMKLPRFGGSSKLLVNGVQGGEQAAPWR
jgi:transposase